MQNNWRRPLQSKRFTLPSISTAPWLLNNCPTPTYAVAMSLYQNSNERFRLQIHGKAGVNNYWKFLQFIQFTNPAGPALLLHIIATKHPTIRGVPFIGLPLLWSCSVVCLHQQQDAEIIHQINTPVILQMACIQQFVRMFELTYNGGLFLHASCMIMQWGCPIVKWTYGLSSSFHAPAK